MWEPSGQITTSGLALVVVVLFLSVLPVLFIVFMLIQLSPSLKPNLNSNKKERKNDTVIKIQLCYSMHDFLYTFWKYFISVEYALVWIGVQQESLFYVFIDCDV